MTDLLPNGMYSPGSEDGWALPGDTNFAGPGFSGKYRMRPRHPWDLAAKLHDLTYQLNKLSFKDRPTISKWTERQTVALSNGLAWTGNTIVEVAESATDLIVAGMKQMPNLVGIMARTYGGARPNQSGRTTFAYSNVTDYTPAEKITNSHFYKADRVFNLLNEVTPATSTTSQMWDWASRQAFLDNKRYLIKDDGFINPFTDEQYWGPLNEPDQYLMIPYSELGNNAPTKKRTIVTRGGIPQEIQEPDWYAQHPADDSPGFHTWFVSTYRSILSELRAL